MPRSSILIVVACLLTALSLWQFVRLLQGGANPVFFAVPGLGLALAYVLARAGLDLRRTDGR